MWNQLTIAICKIENIRQIMHIWVGIFQICSDAFCTCWSIFGTYKRYIESLVKRKTIHFSTIIELNIQNKSLFEMSLKPSNCKIFTLIFLCLLQLFLYSAMAQNAGNLSKKEIYHLSNLKKNIVLIRWMRGEEQRERHGR
jgi:hypothetical protein